MNHLNSNIHHVNYFYPLSLQWTYECFLTIGSWNFQICSLFNKDAYSQMYALQFICIACAYRKHCSKTLEPLNWIRVPPSCCKQAHPQVFTCIVIWAIRGFTLLRLVYVLLWSVNITQLLVYYSIYNVALVLSKVFISVGQHDVNRYWNRILQWVRN